MHVVGRMTFFHLECGAVNVLTSSSSPTRLSKWTFLLTLFIHTSNERNVFSAGQMCKTLPSLDFGGTLGSDGDFLGARQRTIFSCEWTISENIEIGSYHCSRTHLISDMIRHPQTSRYSWSNKELSAEARKRFFTNLIRIPATNSGCKYWPATLLGMCGLMQYNTTSPSYSLLLQVHLRMYSKFGNVENPNWISVAISMFVRSCTPKFNL